MKVDHDLVERHPLDIVPANDRADRLARMKSASQMLAALGLRGSLVDLEDEPPRRPIAPERFRGCRADHGYFAVTDYEVTEKTFAQEDARLSVVHARSGESSELPPGGMVCSHRLGAVSTLL